MIHVEGFEIVDPGDESVGLFGSKYEIRGGFDFEDAEDLNKFIDSLSCTFEMIMAGKPEISSIFN